MAIWCSLLLGLFMGLRAYLAGTRPGERWSPLKRGFAKKPIGTTLSLLLGVAFLYAFTFGSHQFAGWLHDTAAPSRDQLREARALVVAPIVVPFLAWLTWASWQARKSIAAAYRQRLHAPRFVDPSRERRIEIGTGQGD